MKRLCSILTLLKFDPLIRAFEDFVILDRKQIQTFIPQTWNLSLLMKKKIFSNAVTCIHNLGSCEINNWKKIRSKWEGFKPMTSAIPVQCSINRAIWPTGSWSHCELVIYPLVVKNTRILFRPEFF